MYSMIIGAIKQVHRLTHKCLLSFTLSCRSSSSLSDTVESIVTLGALGLIAVMYQLPYLHSRRQRNLHCYWSYFKFSSLFHG